MLAVYRREINAYFTSAIGYLVLAAFYILSTVWLYYILQFSVGEIAYIFNAMLTVILFIVPVLTMRLMSEDKKLKTDQALLTAPVSLWGLVVGKLLAALTIFALGVSIIMLYAVVLSAFGVLNWPLIIANYIGMLLLGAALISVGMFVSSLTENQVIAAIGAFAAILVMYLINTLSSVVSSSFLKSIFAAISIFDRYSQMANGLLDIATLVFFVSVCVVFTFLTVRVLEKRRWS